MIRDDDFVRKSITFGYSHANCLDIHHGSCNSYCLAYVPIVAGQTYKTYAVIYLIQLIFKIKDLRKNPKKEIPKLLLSYVKSVSLTAIQMMLMRRILCFLANNYRNGQTNLIPANLLSGLYLAVESPSRQAEIALYQVNNTMLIVYNMLKRRGIVEGLEKGECLMFGSAMAIITYFYFNDCDNLRKNYIKTLLDKLLGNV